MRNIQPFYNFLMARQKFFGNSRTETTFIKYKRSLAVQRRHAFICLKQGTLVGFYFNPVPVAIWQEIWEVVSLEGLNQSAEAAHHVSLSKYTVRSLSQNKGGSPGVQTRKQKATITHRFVWYLNQVQLFGLLSLAGEPCLKSGKDVNGSEYG